VVPIIGNRVVPFEEIRWYPFRKLAGPHSGNSASMPLSKKMIGMGQGVFELRFKDLAGIYRLIYYLKKGEAIYLLHGFKKKSQKTPRKNLEVVKLRLKRLV
jgi:phage-related protein